tara:strand:- start:356 stop:1084 length:729 start_codon:yes stop_codon:yes gene_type:complete
MKAPEGIPGELYDAYSMNGEVSILYHYRNDCSDEIQNMINANFTQEEFNKCVKRIKNKEYNYYLDTDLWLYDALEKYPIKGKHICIMGSAYPWYEAMAVVYGAKKCTVIEYSDRTSFHPDIEYIKPGEENNQKFDACLSISSFEHDGLGRYGDPLNPNGDLEAMQNMKKLLKKDGLMYLAVPTGRDKVYFNVHRVYGEKRYPLLIKNWEFVASYGFTIETFTNKFNTGEQSPYQPVAILRNT